MNKRNFYKRVLILASVFLFYITVSADESLEKPLVHSIIDEDIRAIMHDLDNLTMKRNMSSLMIMEMQVEHLQKLVLHAERLSYAAEQIDEAFPGIKMTTESQVTFRALAKQLVDEANNLKLLAEDMQLSELEPAYQKIHTSCSACHLLFRNENLRNQ